MDTATSRVGEPTEAGGGRGEESGAPRPGRDTSRWERPGPREESEPAGGGSQGGGLGWGEPGEGPSAKALLSSRGSASHVSGEHRPGCPSWRNVLRRLLRGRQGRQAAWPHPVAPPSTYLALKRPLCALVPFREHGDGDSAHLSEAQASPPGTALCSVLSLVSATAAGKGNRLGVVPAWLFLRHHRVGLRPEASRATARGSAGPPSGVPVPGRDRL